MDDVAVRVTSVSKSFALPHERARSVKEVFVTPFKTAMHKNTTNQRALRDVSFDVKKGEFFGIVGRNGSGKSTLLKMIAGIYQPSKGKIQLNGKLVPFIELGVGFNPELTGRENVYLNGALLGFSEAEVTDQYDSIVDFAELHDFMDQKLKNYSSGMQVRLAFSMAVRAKADILLLDEVLAVGDADFQRKCYDYFSQLKKEKVTVIFISHDMNAVRQFCDRAIFINDGVIEKRGTPNDVSKAYTELFMNSSAAVTEPGKEQKKWGALPEAVGHVKASINKDKVVISGELSAKSEIRAPVLGFAVKNAEGTSVLGANSRMLKLNMPTLTEKTQAFEVTFANVLSDGQYFVDIALLKEDNVSVITWWNDAVSFAVKKEYVSPYLVDPAIHMKVQRQA